MKLALRALFAFAGLFCLLSAAVQLFAANFNSGVIFASLFGGMLICGGVFFDKIFFGVHKKGLKILRALVCSGVVLVTVFSAMLFIYGIADDVDGDEEVIVVLGAGIHGTKISRPLKYRLDKALEYHEKNPRALITVSGGQGPGEDIPEADAMGDYLEANGVPARLIIRERGSFGTDENLDNSRALLAPILGEDFKAAIVTSGFHSMRAAWTAKSRGWGDVGHIGAKIMWYNVPVCYIRECAAFLWYVIK